MSNLIKKSWTDSNMYFKNQMLEISTIKVVLDVVLPILNFESRFCELSLHKSEKRELFDFSSDFETVIPIGRKNSEKL